jgi:hypothetical protein
MKRITGISLLAGTLFACCMAVSSSPQAAPISVNICKIAPMTQCSGIVSEVQMRRVPSLFKPQIPTDQLAPPRGTRPVHQCDVKFLAERTAVGQGDRVTLRI